MGLEGPAVTVTTMCVLLLTTLFAVRLIRELVAPRPTTPMGAPAGVWDPAQQQGAQAPVLGFQAGAQQAFVPFGGQGHRLYEPRTGQAKAVPKAPPNNVSSASR